MSNRRRSDAIPQLSPRRPQRLPPGSPLVTLAVCARVTIPSHTSCSYPPVRLTRRHRAPAKLRSPCLLHLPPILAPLNVQLVLRVSIVHTPSLRCLRKLGCLPFLVMPSG
ncbi:hypothetical protein PAHAL_5G085000 [Panicum hallii]|uniref:Uncharacterized protein n=1 Tax=Panicum hallii TaxID=206008 RepID=A0A2S3HPX1_9POAL|nr:hypothetical protein PAHAL_5G085000 [Panicum hallii]